MQIFECNITQKIRAINLAFIRYFGLRNFEMRVAFE